MGTTVRFWELIIVILILAAGDYTFVECTGKRHPRDVTGQSRLKDQHELNEHPLSGQNFTGGSSDTEPQIIVVPIVPSQECYLCSTTTTTTTVPPPSTPAPSTDELPLSATQSQPAVHEAKVVYEKDGPPMLPHVGPQQLSQGAVLAPGKNLEISTGVPVYDKPGPPYLWRDLSGLLNNPYGGRGGYGLGYGNSYRGSFGNSNRNPYRGAFGYGNGNGNPYGKNRYGYNNMG